MLYSLFRSLSPVFAGIVYSVSLTSGLGYPLDYHLIFVIMAGIILVVMVMDWWLDFLRALKDIKSRKEMKRILLMVEEHKSKKNQIDQSLRI